MIDSIRALVVVPASPSPPICALCPAPAATLVQVPHDGLPSVAMVCRDCARLPPFTLWLRIVAQLNHDHPPPDKA